MASQSEISAAVRRHMGMEQTPCDVDNLQCRDFFFGCCAGQCVYGLLMHLAEPNGNVTKEKAGVCGQALFCPVCYPCVITDGCICMSFAGSIGNDATDSQLGSAAVSAYNASIRAKLLRRAGDTSSIATSFIQQFCGPCFCTPCHNAAIVREIRPAGYGKFWCPPSKSDVTAALL